MMVNVQPVLCTSWGAFYWNICDITIYALLQKKEITCIWKMNECNCTSLFENK